MVLPLAVSIIFDKIHKIGHCGDNKEAGCPVDFQLVINSTSSSDWLTVAVIFWSQVLEVTGGPKTRGGETQHDLVSENRRSWIRKQKTEEGTFTRYQLWITFILFWSTFALPVLFGYSDAQWRESHNNEMSSQASMRVERKTASRHAD